MCDSCFGLLKNGYVCLNENGFKIMKKVEDDILNFLFDIEYKEIHIPALIDGEVLRKCDYFKSFPNHLTVAGVANKNKLNDIILKQLIDNNSLKTIDMYFTPAACIHVYPMFENKVIDNECITTRARVYRYENGNFYKMVRLWDFTVREIVFIGNKDYVMNKLNTIEMRALEYARTFFKSSRFNIANDHFYPSEENKIKQKIQKANKMKKELLVTIDKSDIAIASINYHGTHFSKAFNFDKDSNIVTGCIGFGLERWVQLLLT